MRIIIKEGNKLTLQFDTENKQKRYFKDTVMLRQIFGFIGDTERDRTQNFQAKQQKRSGSDTNTGGYRK